MNTIKRAAGAIMIAATMWLSACGGGGNAGQSLPATTPPSSNWDSMVWDQGNWG
jgi:hypothetical protein